MDEDKAFEAGWEYRVVHKAYEAMLNTDLALKQIIQLFDSDGDGLVSPQEFKQAMQVLQSSQFPLLATPESTAGLVAEHRPTPIWPVSAHRPPSRAYSFVCIRLHCMPHFGPPHTHT